ncbi:hypothetical protein EV580_4732 [Mycobacterium sp. BK086]|uniref:hypothetical protein n=1 Tax=Mycobacterium sp. BK086 TaxID=2512165 RepID=UPI001060E1A7|nr:hypothetical protein [Mycobacterium sp. BK086]TDO10444.1 hypothetical protein EV580_4732 [Mycobacterium sp. BK086]
MANQERARRFQIVTAGMVGAAGFVIALAGAGMAHADGLVANPGSVDTDGTQGSWAEAVHGSQRPTQGVQFDSHTFENGGCEIGLGNQVCHTSGLWSKASNDADSALDTDGMQADAVRGPNIAAAPPARVSLPRGY